MSSQFPGVQPTPQSTRPQYGKPKSSATKIVLIILGIVGGLGLLGCGCCGGVWYWGVSNLSNVVKEQYSTHPTFQDKIGEVQKFSTNLTATGEQGQGALVFDVKGSKGSGQLIVRDQQGASFGSATLIVDGKSYPLQ